MSDKGLRVAKCDQRKPLPRAQSQTGTVADEVYQACGIEAMTAWIGWSNDRPFTFKACLHVEGGTGVENTRWGRDTAFIDAREELCRVGIPDKRAE
jgi:hypothetical protein